MTGFSMGMFVSVGDLECVFAYESFSMTIYAFALNRYSRLVVVAEKHNQTFQATYYVCKQSQTKKKHTNNFTCTSRVDEVYPHNGGKIPL